MEKYSPAELAQALTAVSSIMHKCERAQEKFPQGSAHHTLLKNRIQAMGISKYLIENAIAAQPENRG